MTNRPLIIALVAVAGALGGAVAAYWLFGDPREALDGAPQTATAAFGGERPAFTLPDLGGRPRTVSEWDGRVVLLNFWATWCPPCRREMPLLAELQAELGERGLRVVGVAIDERDAVRAFVADHGIDFPILVGGADAVETARQYGNHQGALPYSVVIGRDGRLAARFPGELTRERIEALLHRLL